MRVSLGAPLRPNTWLAAGLALLIAEPAPGQIEPGAASPPQADTAAHDGPVELTVKAQPAEVVLGEGAGEVELEIHAWRGGKPVVEAQVAVHATAGVVSELTRVGPGR